MLMTELRPQQLARVVVIGTGCSRKTTLAHQLASVYGHAVS
jgi:hypothetical protein